MCSTGRTALILLLASAASVDAGLAASATEGSSPSPPTVVRVLYLQGMEVEEAATLLRSQVQVMKIATLSDRDIVVVADLTERVDDSERLLRDRDAILRLADPHAPLDLERANEAPAATRVFRVDDSAVVVVLLRSLYQVKDVSAQADDRSVTIRAAEPILAASEALLRELGLLAEPSPHAER